jgi:hypothetical protein
VYALAEAAALAKDEIVTFPGATRGRFEESRRVVGEPIRLEVGVDLMTVVGHCGLVRHCRQG